MFLQWIPVVVRNAQRLRQAVPGVFTSALGLLLATGCFVPVSASAFIQTEPSLVGPGEPFRLVVQLGTTGPSGDPEPRVEIDGQEILVHVRLGLGGITGPPDVVLFTADVGPLPEGQYEVKILASLEGPGGTGVEVDSKQIDIGGPYVFDRTRVRCSRRTL